MKDAGPLLALLKQQDCPCPGCGYNLRGVTQPKCPECGHGFDADMLLSKAGRTDPAWLIMLIACAAALPWSVLYVWQRLLIRWRIHYGDSWHPGTQTYDRGLIDRDLPEMVWGIASTAWWLSIPFVLGLLVVFRKKVSRWPGPLRWVLAVACVLMVVLAYRRWQWWYYHIPWQSGKPYAYWPMWYLD